MLSNGRYAADVLRGGVLRGVLRRLVQRRARLYPEEPHYAPPHYVSHETGPGGTQRLSFNIRVF